jgi:DNA-binding beta-propeller fold protein YncE
MRVHPVHGAFAAAGTLLCILTAPAAVAQLPRGFPFEQRQRAAALDGGTEWLNTPQPLSPEDLRGKFVLLDFWTSCCINCMHVLPELKKLEHAYPHELVVIGVHSAKFDEERDPEFVRQAILRYGMEHPVLNDPRLVLWSRYGIDTWPTLVLIDPEGNEVSRIRGETTFEQLDRILRRALPYYRQRGLLRETPLVFDFERQRAPATPLRFPGKVLADADTNRLYVADSSHCRIVVATLEGEVVEIIGTGEPGREDGPYDQATFDHPQGLALHGQRLYVADTENHLIRVVDLEARRVTTLAGTGKQRRLTSVVGRKVSGRPLRVALNSPWGLCVHGDYLYIAMAGPHQIWRLALDGSLVELYAGTGIEDIVDGSLLGRASEGSAFAQPSGLATDGNRLFVADSEGSSIRAVPLVPRGRVVTLLGTAHLPENRLFTFGDVDGPQDMARLQHPLDVAWQNGMLYVADTYNHKIKLLDPDRGTLTTIAGDGQSGNTDRPPRFHHPSGLSVARNRLYVADTNNHLIRVIDLREGYPTATLELRGLQPPAAPRGKKPAFPAAEQLRLATQLVAPENGAVSVRVKLELPDGFHLHEMAAPNMWIEAQQPAGIVDPALLQRVVRPEVWQDELSLRLPVTAAEGSDVLRVWLGFYYCSAGPAAACKYRSVVWTVPITLSDQAATSSLLLEYAVQD